MVLVAANETCRMLGTRTSVMSVSIRLHCNHCFCGPGHFLWIATAAFKYPCFKFYCDPNAVCMTRGKHFLRAQCRKCKIESKSHVTAVNLSAVSTLRQSDHLQDAVIDCYHLFFRNELSALLTFNSTKFCRAYQIIDESSRRKNNVTPQLAEP